MLRHFGHGHFGLGRFGLDISATDVSATENAEGGRFGQNHKFSVWDVFMHKCVMHSKKIYKIFFLCFSTNCQVDLEVQVKGE